MSTLKEIKGLIFGNLYLKKEDGTEDKELKSAVFDLFESIDGDLDEGMYEQSTETDAYVEKFNQVLAARTEEEESADADAILAEDVVQEDISEVVTSINKDEGPEDNPLKSTESEE